ncbi:AAA family ATPase [Planomonospora algeriensis]
MLLRFRVANHRSIRDEQTLSFVAARSRGLAGQRTNGTPRTAPVAGIYGANASGKSNVLDALRWMQWAVETSQTRWAPSAGIPRHPFLLSEQGRSTASLYELDFVHDGIRYTYGFEVDDEAVRGEWLYSFPHGRPRRLFERAGPDQDAYEFSRMLTGETRRIAKLTRGNALYLSSAASNNHSLLSALELKIVTCIQFASHDDHDERRRLLVTKLLLRDPAAAADINTLLQLADLGIERAELVKDRLLAEADERFKRIYRTTSDGSSALDAGSELETLSGRIQLRRANSTTALSIEDESAGTRVWLSIIGPVIGALKSGSVFVVDEIDSSMHPLLSSSLIRMFKDPEINRRGARLLFASHDTTLLGNLLSEDLLSRDEVWFTEKDGEGATSLFPLTDFHPRRDENVERGYLQGRYGAVPYVNLEKVREIFHERHAGPHEHTA